MAQSIPRLVNFWNAQPGGLRHPDLGQQFARLQRGLEQALEERPDRDLPFPTLKPFAQQIVVIKQLFAAMLGKRTEIG
ncbi:MAG: hypothetical protein ABR922_17625 [Streptosporangiaceae bacterium]|jgi:hypothetical protein